MFKPKTERIRQLGEKYPDRMQELERIFSGHTNIYIDYANVRPWANKLGWHLDLKRLKQFLDSFENVKSVKIYHGTLIGDQKSEQLINEIKSAGYELTTKPVKIMRISMDVSSISPESPDILKNFIRAPLLRILKLEVIGLLNNELRALNKQGKLYLEDRKCNFDVEIGRDMLIDDRNGAEVFVLWSGDSDFADPLAQLLKDGKKVLVFATARKVSWELSKLAKKGLGIYDIQKIRDFICWNREIKQA
jgi:uncharacterized LabA/DUF88 family protein